MPGDSMHPADGLDEQQEQVVRRYALKLRAAAANGPEADRGSGTRRAYEILNECAMELARLTRQPNAAPDDCDTRSH
jgi:hypothetical protein